MRLGIKSPVNGTNISKVKEIQHMMMRGRAELQL
jgi:hypothetical protein